MPRTEKLGWALCGKYWHLVVRPERVPGEKRGPETVACGLPIERFEGKALDDVAKGGGCAKCRSYADKRRWL